MALLEQGDFLVEHSLVVTDTVDVVFVILVVVDTGLENILFYLIWGFRLELKISDLVKNWILDALFHSWAKGWVELYHGLYQVDQSGVGVGKEVLE